MSDLYLYEAFYDSPYKFSDPMGLQAKEGGVTEKFTKYERNNPRDVAGTKVELEKTKNTPTPTNSIDNSPLPEPGEPTSYRYLIWSSVHPDLGVDVWVKEDGQWAWVREDSQWAYRGIKSYSFSIDDSNPFAIIGTGLTIGSWPMPGKITDQGKSSVKWLEDNYNVKLDKYKVASTIEENRKLVEELERQKKNPPCYSVLFGNCRHWAYTMLQYGMSDKKIYPYWFWYGFSPCPTASSRAEPRENWKSGY